LQVKEWLMEELCSLNSVGRAGKLPDRVRKGVKLCCR
jgi:hypothetical protein